MENREDYSEFLSNVTLSNKSNNRSELSEEFITNSSQKIEKWLWLSIIIIFLMTVAAFWFIRYPDTIEARAVLTSKEGAKELLFVKDGHIAKLLKVNGDLVKKDDAIAYLESTASHQDVLRLLSEVDKISTSIYHGRILETDPGFENSFQNLGELQTVFQAFIEKWQIYNDYMVNGYFDRKKKSLNDDVVSLYQSATIIKKKKKLIEDDILLAKESFDMVTQLYKEKVLTKEELRTQSSRLVSKEVSLPQLNSELLQNEDLLRSKKDEIAQLLHNYSLQQIIITQALQSLKSEIIRWKKNFILTAPANGQINFIIPLHENRFSKANEIVGYVIPPNNKYYAEAYIPQSNFEKLKSGCRVQLRFDAYPFQKIGFVEGELSYISPISSNGNFLTIISLPNGLSTVTKRSIPFKDGLQARAIIITSDKRLFDKIFYEVLQPIIH